MAEQGWRIGSYACPKLIVTLAAPSSPPVGGSVLLHAQSGLVHFFCFSKRNEPKKRSPEKPTCAFGCSARRHRFAPFPVYPRAVLNKVRLF